MWGSEGCRSALLSAEEFIPAAPSPLHLLLCLRKQSHPNNSSHIFNFLPPLLSPPSSSLISQANIGPAAFLWAFCPCSGRRLAHSGSCYNFHFLNIFLFFCVEARRVFYPSLQHEDEGRGGGRGQDGSSNSGSCHSNHCKQIKYKLHVAEGSGWRVAVVRFGHSGGVDHVCGTGGA